MPDAATAPAWSREARGTREAEAAIGRQEYLDYLRAKEALASMESRIEALAGLFSPQAVETYDIQVLLQGLKDDIDAQRRCNEIVLRRLPTEHRTPRSPQLADRVFGTPELLERILLSVSVPDLLRAYSVAKVFCNTIERRIPCNAASDYDQIHHLIWSFRRRRFSAIRKA